MTVRDPLYRGYNLLGTALVAISGFAFFPQTFSEDEFSHKLDEGGLFLLAIGALIWYFAGHNNVSHTIVPLLFAAAAPVCARVGIFDLAVHSSAAHGGAGVRRRCRQVVGNRSFRSVRTDVPTAATDTN